IVFEAPWDIFAHGFMLMGIYYLTVLYYTDTNRLRFGLLAGLFMGCSFLSKGPIPMYALFLPFLISFGIIYRFKGFKRKWPILILAFVVAIMIGGWWFVYVRIMDPETFVSIAERETNNWHSYNTKPIYYYWSFFAQSGIWTIPAFIALLYPYLKKRVSNLKAYQFSLLWTVLAVLLLSLVPEKKSRYLMPVLIPMAINTGFYIEYLIRSFKELKEKKTLLPVHFNFGLIGIVALGAPVALFFLLGESLKKHWIGFAFSSLIMILIGVAIILFLKQKNFRNVFLLTVAFFVSTFMFVLPVLKNSVGKPISPLTITNHENLTVYGMDYVSPEIIWYYGDIIKPLKMADGSYSFPNEKQFGIIGSGLNEKDRHALQKRYHIEEKASFDLNPTIGSRHNDRLIGEFYILTEL
ncbi:MAG TPA: glycosyltransferase, partial [Aquaticitalea sp.]|nr:glycosyltransferase [Aquaticitalea sp.]